jgi:DNA-binding HxlR family transcriptional regulator
MNIKINLQEDEQLRNEIKNIIRGQVKKIIKEELKDLIHQEFLSELKKSLYKKKAETLFDEELHTLIKTQVDRLAVTDEFHNKIIKPIAERIISDHLSNLNLDDMVETLAKNMITELVNRL